MLRSAATSTLTAIVLSRLTQVASHPHILTGHKDSVTCTGFSSDGKYAATADMGGGVRVWRVEGGELVCSFETSDIEVGIVCLVPVPSVSQTNVNMGIRLNILTVDAVAQQCPRVAGRDQ